MSAPRTAKDALLVELFSDMDDLVSRFEKAQKRMDALEAVIERSYDTKASQAARDLDAATVKFGEVTTRSVDDFVNVANEALSKFMQRTNEIKDLLDRPISAPSHSPEQPQQKPQEASGKEVWLRPVWHYGLGSFLTMFALGVAVGVGLAIVFAQ